MSMRPRDSREKVIPEPPHLANKPLVELKLGVQRVVVVLPVEEQQGLSSEQLLEDPDEYGEVQIVSLRFDCEQNKFKLILLRVFRRFLDRQMLPWDLDHNFFFFRSFWECNPVISP